MFYNLYKTFGVFQCLQVMFYLNISVLWLHQKINNYPFLDGCHMMNEKHDRALVWVMKEFAF